MKKLYKILIGVPLVLFAVIGIFFTCITVISLTSNENWNGIQVAKLNGFNMPLNFQYTRYTSEDTFTNYPFLKGILDSFSETNSSIKLVTTAPHQELMNLKNSLDKTDIHIIMYNDEFYLIQFTMNG